MTRLSLLERVALGAFALCVVSAGFQVGDGDGWWRLPASVALVVAGLAVAAALVFVVSRQPPRRHPDGGQQGDGGQQEGVDDDR